MKKITRRIIWILKSIPYIVPALIFEPNKHPWKYIFDYLTISAEKRYSYTGMYLQKYFAPQKTENFMIVSCGEFLVKIPIELYEKETFMLGFLAVYFDIIYPLNVRFPIPVIVEEGPYELVAVDLKKGDYVIDAGANIGIFSMHAVTKIGPDGKVFSFEPIKEAAAVIDDSIKLNKMSEVIKIVPLALGKTAGTVDFKFNIDNIGGSSPNAIQGSSIKIPVTTIDDFVAKEKIKKIDFIKMDIEGAECDSLQGAEKTIRQFKPRLAICTYHNPQHPKEIQDIILGIRPDYRYFHTSHKIYAW